MAVAGSRPIWAWLLGLAWLPYLYAAWFMIEVAHGWRTAGRTACATIYDLPYPADGAEATAPALTLAFAAGIGVLLVISRRRNVPHTGVDMDRT